MTNKMVAENFYELKVELDKSTTEDGVSKIIWTCCLARSSEAAVVKAEKKFDGAKVSFTGTVFTSESRGNWPILLQKTID